MNGGSLLPTRPERREGTSLTWGAGMAEVSVRSVRKLMKAKVCMIGERNLAR
jgi:hypothetical protein